MLEIICENCFKSYDTKHLPHDIDDESVRKDAKKTGWSFGAWTLCYQCGETPIKSKG